jgi:hypothetical protein
MLSTALAAVDRLHTLGVSLEASPDGRLIFDGPDAVLTDEVVGWIGKHKAQLLEALAPPDPEPESSPVAALPDEWTDGSVHPGLMDAIRRSIPVEALRETLAFHREMNAAGRKRAKSADPAREKSEATP